jgi:Uma2 family endonuclease
MSTQSKSFLTPEEYLEIERKKEWKNEYYRGETIPMPLPGISHCAIVGNAGGELHEQLRKRPARAYMSALRLFVPSGPLYTYPRRNRLFSERPKFKTRATTTRSSTQPSSSKYSQRLAKHTTGD